MIAVKRERAGKVIKEKSCNIRERIANTSSKGKEDEIRSRGGITKKGV